MKFLPLKPSERELTHSRLLPNWRDEFDLRRYFACIHPADFQLEDPTEVGFALEVYAVVQAYCVHRVGIYRGAMRALPECPGLLPLVNDCARSFYYRRPAEHLTWYETANERFGGEAPLTWFLARNLWELAHSLRGCANALDPGWKQEMRLEAETSHPGGVKLCRSVKQLEDYKRELAPEARRLVDAVYLGFSEDGWEDEFDLAPYLATWSPLGYDVSDHTRYREALELYEMMRGEFCGWVRLYRTALSVACDRAGTLAAVAHCTSQVREGERDLYLKWFDSPQAEFFGGTAPRFWFRTMKLAHLEWMLGMGRRGPEESEESDP